MKFSQLAAGVDQSRTVEITLRGKLCKPLVRPLTMLEEVDVVAYAIKAAKEKGAEPVKGNEIFDAATMAKACHLAYLDEDSPANARQPFFDEGPEAVLTLDKDTIALLFERQEIRQSEASPAFSVTSGPELMGIIRELVDGEGQRDPFFLLRFAPTTRLALVRTMAVLLAESHVLKPSSTSLSSPPTTST